MIGYSLEKQKHSGRRVFDRKYQYTPTSLNSHHHWLQLCCLLFLVGMIEWTDKEIPCLAPQLLSQK